MKPLNKLFISLVLAGFVLTGSAFASSDKKMADHDMAGHDMAGQDMSKSDQERIGTLFHESMKDGYMLSYYLMDLRDQNSDAAAEHGSHGKKEMDKPHHIMVYIMDKDHKIVEEAKVGFLIKGGTPGSQKTMGMYMSKGFGITADMKAKGSYTIVTKALIGKDQVMDSFEYEMK